MNIKFFEDLERFIKNNNLFDGDLKHVFISVKFLPYGLKRVISSKVRETVYSNMEMDKEFELFLDKEGELCLRITYNNGHTNIILKNGDLPHVDFRYTMYPLEEVLKDAAYIELEKDLYDTAIEALEIQEKDKTQSERQKKAAIEVNKIIDSFPKDSIITESQIEDKLNRILPSIKEYILYCYNYSKEYKDQIISLDGENTQGILYYDRGIDYIQRKSSMIVDEESMGSFYLGPKERINGIIDYDKREDLLLSMHPIMVDYGTNEANNQIEYKCILYRVSDNEYKFLFEPFTGRKCTKVFFFKYNEEIKYGDFCRLAEKYLEMSEQEVIQSGYGIRINHTKEEVYNEVIRFVITEDQKLNVSQRLKQKINDLEYDTSELEKTV